MESWRTVWREGFSKVLSLRGLKALAEAIHTDDLRLVQGSTTVPPPLICVEDWPVEGADAIGLAGWLGDGLTTVGEVENHFAKACYECDQLLKEPAACRWFLTWHDDTPRQAMRAELYLEVMKAIGERVDRNERELCPQ